MANQKSVVGVFYHKADADNCFNSLLHRGLTTSEINVMMSERTRNLYFAEGAEYDLEPQQNEQTGSSAGSRAIEGMGVGGAVGTAMGATIAAIAALGTSLLIPGLNVIVAGPLAAALAGGGAGALAGGLVGALAGLGVPEQNAQVYNEAMNQGGVVISVTPRTADQISEIKQVMIDHHGQEVCSCS